MWVGEFEVGFDSGEALAVVVEGGVYLLESVSDLVKSAVHVRP